MTALIPFPDISPELFSFELFGLHVALRWYALAYIVGILLAWLATRTALKRAALWPGNQPPMAPAQLEDLLTWSILGVILGGRLGYVLFYRPAYFLENPAEIPMVWQGGMAFHGGFLGVVLAAWLFARKHNIPKLSMADAVAIGVPWGLMLGRIANFINAELWGRPTDLPWGVAFPGQAAQDCPGIVGLCARHPSQLYEAALEGLILGLLLVWLVWRRGGLKTPGLVSGVFFAGYGAARFFVEFFRQADTQFITPDNPMGHVIHWGGWGLSMGQLLSLPMLLLGLGLIALSRRSRAA
ncbi:prolipoprotein diacylglyceryl transferase [Marimonas arenosa]|uniref:Phosphatidylglycerol--prolipoprotein diacylglyceryl transferase n=1 Tax=Marimonas arenosa TaxID=1795305 RepID=A0AAE4B4D6_9RHOB|nr:prolipoprotein diacylglyceryl transferase [Marimonas arenosa]MDQ2090112.1 prolipoprotein diacylglyceryl transferase [Marimonas arenosa]